MQQQSGTTLVLAGMHERRTSRWCPTKVVPLSTSPTKAVPHSTSPEDSYEDASSNTLLQQPHPKRRTSKIVRRKEPTVDIRPLLTAPATSTETDPPQIECSTLEVRSSHTLKPHYEPEREDTESAAVCGWRTDEHFKAKFENTTQHLLAVERTHLQSREKSSRLYSSQLNSRLCKRRSYYSFCHFDSQSEHIEHYRDNCSFSHLIIASRNPGALSEKHEQQTDCLYEEPNTTGHPPNQRSTSTNTQQRSPNRSTSVNAKSTSDKGPYRLHSLATRLGVVDSIREPHLIQSNPTSTSRPTPPSITSKRRPGVNHDSKVDTDDLSVRGPQLQRDYINGSQTNQGIPAVKNTSKVSPSSSSSKQQVRHFPPLTKPIRRKSDNSSTISLTKYLNVGTRGKTSKSPTAKNSLTKNEEEKEGLENETNCNDSDSSFLSSVSSTNYLVQEREEEAGECLLQQPWSIYGQLDMKNNTAVKDEVITRKANSLGLTSHKWARDFIERGFMNGSISRKIFYDLSRPSTREKTNHHQRSSRTEGGERGGIIPPPPSSSKLERLPSSHYHRLDSSKSRNCSGKGRREEERKGGRGGGGGGGESFSDKLQRLESVYKKSNSSDTRKVESGNQRNQKLQDSIEGRGKGGEGKREGTSARLKRGVSEPNSDHKTNPRARLLLTHSVNPVSFAQRDNSAAALFRRVSSRGERGQNKLTSNNNNNNNNNINWHIRGEKFLT